jgi:dimethylargininase
MTTTPPPARPRVAVVRPPSDAFARALSSAPGRQPIDPARARDQHAVYCQTLRRLGLELVELPPDPDLPDACFVDDCAVVTGGDVLLARLGAPTRADEPERLAPTVAALAGQVERIEPPATLEGGDVLQVAGTLVAGRSTRTNQAGVDRLAAFARSRGLGVVAVDVPDGVLHLQTVVSALPDDGLLGTETMLSALPSPLATHQVQCADGEEAAANVVTVGRGVLMAAGFPATAAALRALRYDVHEVDLSEFAKADGGPSCLSLLL